MSEATEHDIQKAAEGVDPGSAETLAESREAIDDAYDAARTTVDQDLTDVEFDPADSGPAGAEDEAEDEATDQDSPADDEPGGSEESDGSQPGGSEESDGSQP